MDENILAEYKEAYAAANPDNPSIKVTYLNGWYHIHGSPYRKKQLIGMRDTLRERTKKE